MTQSLKKEIKNPRRKIILDLKYEKYKLVPWREVENSYSRGNRKDDMLKISALEALRDLRNELGLTQEELAMKAVYLEQLVK